MTHENNNNNPDHNNNNNANSKKKEQEVVEYRYINWNPPIYDKSKNEINIRWKDKGKLSKNVKLVGTWITWKCKDATKLRA